MQLRCGALQANTSLVAKLNQCSMGERPSTWTRTLSSINLTSNDWSWFSYTSPGASRIKWLCILSSTIAMLFRSFCLTATCKTCRWVVRGPPSTEKLRYYLPDLPIGQTLGEPLVLAQLTIRTHRRLGRWIFVTIDCPHVQTMKAAAALELICGTRWGLRVLRLRLAPFQWLAIPRHWNSEAVQS